MKTVFKGLLAAALMLVPASAMADFKNKHDRDSRFNDCHNSHWQGGRGYGVPRNPYYAPRPSFGYAPSRNPGSGNIFHQQISNGIRTGQLSRDEVRELKDKHNDIRREEAAYRSDGRLNRDEREDLRRDYRDLSKDLRHELNDGERGRVRGWRY